MSIDKIAQIHHEDWVKTTKRLLNKLELTTNRLRFATTRIADKYKQGLFKMIEKNEDLIKHYINDCFKPYHQLEPELKNADRQFAKKIMKVIE